VVWQWGALCPEAAQKIANGAASDRWAYAIATVEISPHDAVIVLLVIQKG
jgi:hypothetical protein